MIPTTNHLDLFEECFKWNSIAVWIEIIIAVDNPRRMKVLRKNPETGIMACLLEAE